jgi:1-acyl-sn-glycerol-3-phosphate acyltransferase
MGFTSRTILKMIGWKAVNTVKDFPDKCIITSAPHTSFWDFVLGRLCMWALDIESNFLIKQEMFRFPFRHLLLWSGGTPVDRGRGSNLVKPIVDIIKKTDKFHLVITPEGTRKLTKNWKRGYYFIAHAANIPIVLGYIDYKEKVCAMTQVLYPTGHYEEDFKIIETFYRGHVAKNPEWFNLS